MYPIPIKTPERARQKCDCTKYYIKASWAVINVCFFLVFLPAFACFLHWSLASMIFSSRTLANLHQAMAFSMGSWHDSRGFLLAVLPPCLLEMDSTMCIVYQIDITQQHPRCIKMIQDVYYNDISVYLRLFIWSPWCNMRDNSKSVWVAWSLERVLLSQPRQEERYQCTQEEASANMYELKPIDFL